MIKQEKFKLFQNLLDVKQIDKKEKSFRIHPSNKVYIPNKILLTEEDGN
jgi:hypothetical protein